MLTVVKSKLELLLRFFHLTLSSLCLCQVIKGFNLAVFPKSFYLESVSKSPRNHFESKKYLICIYFSWIMWSQNDTYLERRSGVDYDFILQQKNTN